MHTHQDTGKATHQRRAADMCNHNNTHTHTHTHMNHAAESVGKPGPASVVGEKSQGGGEDGGENAGERMEKEGHAQHAKSADAEVHTHTHMIYIYICVYICICICMYMYTCVCV